MEIYTESKHGALYAAQRPTFDLGADPKRLTTADLPVPTCATCHLSGLDGLLLKLAELEEAAGELRRRRADR